MVVLGDSTGDDTDEFPFLAAQQLASEYNRPVIVHRWADGRGYGEESAFPGGPDAAAIHIWNGSVSGSVGSYAASNLTAMTPAGADLVLINYGHNYAGPQEAKAGISQLLEVIDERLGRPPVLVTIQNPKNPETVLSSAIVEQVRATAMEHVCETVDVHRAFKDAGDLDLLLLDDTHPSPAGSKVWAAAVVKALS
jgi:lysophospholipase L1-like esterase